METKNQKKSSELRIKKRIVKKIDVSKRIALEECKLNQGFVLVPFCDYAAERGIHYGIGSCESPDLNAFLISKSIDYGLIAALKVGDLRLRFAQFHLPKPTERVTGILDNPNREYQLKSGIVSYEGYSHLELGPKGLEIAIQRATFFDDFSKTNSQKLWGHMEKELFPTFIAENTKGEQVLCAILDDGGRKMIDLVVNWMRAHRHTFIRYHGNGKMDYDVCSPLYEFSTHRQERQYEEEFGRLSLDYVKKTFEEALKRL